MFAPTSIVEEEDQYWLLVLDKKYYKSSEKDGWHKIDLDAFQIDMPQEYYYYRVKGIDSFVGEIATKNRENVYSFDYGWYSNELDTYYSDGNYDVSGDTLQGKYARLVLPNNEKALYSGIHI